MWIELMKFTFIYPLLVDFYFIDNKLKVNNSILCNFNLLSKYGAVIYYASLKEHEGFDILLLM